MRQGIRHVHNSTLYMLPKVSNTVLLRARYTAWGPLAETLIVEMVL